MAFGIPYHTLGAVWPGGTARAQQTAPQKGRLPVSYSSSCTKAFVVKIAKIAAKDFGGVQDVFVFSPAERREKGCRWHGRQKGRFSQRSHPIGSLFLEFRHHAVAQNRPHMGNMQVGMDFSPSLVVQVIRREMSNPQSRPINFVRIFSPKYPGDALLGEKDDHTCS